MSLEKKNCHILGLDIGANSIGWALLDADMPSSEKRLKPFGIIKAGVRIFEAGVKGDLSSGKEESRAKARREARGIRRRLDRTSRRLSHLFNILVNAGLLPMNGQYKREPVASKKSSKERKLERELKTIARNATIVELDKEILKKWESSEPAINQNLPYFLRAKSLDLKLEHYELGRAIYHLAQRRGFLSNRKALKKKEEELGVVKKCISELEKLMQDAGARTLGEYFSKIDPEQERIRSRYTSRSMYEDEFARIWESQSVHYPELLTPQLKQKILKTIFYQRPLRSQSHLIGKCQFEKDRKRAHAASLLFQRFRILQSVNNLEIITPDYEKTALTPEQRALLVDKLSVNGDLKFSDAKKILKLSKGFKFNLEEGGEKRFCGNRTSAKLIEVLGTEFWMSLKDEEREQIVQDLISIDNEKGLMKRAKNRWGLNDKKAKEFSRIELEDGYCSLSRQALAKLLPLMEKGKRYGEAVSEVYPERMDTIKYDLLIPIQEAKPDITNPAVKRALTELRKIVNALIREYGKPDAVRIELARDLKKPREERKKISDKNRRREGWRKDAAKKITAETGITNPTGRDIVKALLWQECKECPYTGKQINFNQLFGESPQFDVEHIIPLSRCLDDSFENKTLCYSEENRNVKHNRTPWEAYGSDEERWNEIIMRVKGFQGEAREAKLKRFLLKDIEEIEDFADRQLNDTRYASKEAKQYLGLLYGEEALSRIQASKGQITYYLRNVWNLNRILGDGGEKSRDDHRHHAVDAVCTALSEPAIVKRLSEAAERAHLERRRNFADVEPPWENFYYDLKNAIENMTVSHRVSKKVNGPLHEETNYSREMRDTKGNNFHCVRKKLESLSTGELDNIVDPVVRQRVKEKIEELGGGEPRKLFSDPANTPCMTAKDGRRIPIRKVRIKVSISPFPVGKNGRERFVVSDTNHHLEIVEFTDERGRKKWEGYIVNRYEAMRRLREGEPVIINDHGEGKKFIFSLALNESVMMKNDEGKEEIFTVKCISQFSAGQILIRFYRNAEARPVTELKKSKGSIINKVPNTLMMAEARKILIDPIGNIRNAND